MLAIYQPSLTKFCEDNLGRTIISIQRGSYGHLSTLRGAVLVTACACLLLVGAGYAVMNAQFKTPVFAQGAPTGQFGNPLNMSADSYNAKYPNVAASGSYVYVVWSEGTHGIYIRVSSNYGASFGGALRLSPFGGVASYPVLAANGSYVYVAWAQTPSTNNITLIYFTSSSNYGYSFSTATTLSQNLVNALTPGIAASNSTVYVTWTADSASNNGTYVRTSTNGGASFYPTFQSSVGYRQSDIAADGNYAYIVSAEGNYAFTNDSGSSWTSFTMPLGGTEPAVAASGPYVYVASTARNGTRVLPTILFQVSSNYGQSFGPVISPSGNVTNDWDPTIAAVGGTVYVGFHEYYPNDDWIVSSSNNGSSWTAPYSMSTYNYTTDALFGLTATPSAAFAVYGGATTINGTAWDAFVSDALNSSASWSPAPGNNVSQNSNGYAAPIGTVASANIAASGPYGYAVWMQNETSLSNSTYFQVYFNGPFTSANSTVGITTYKCCSYTTTTNTSIPTISGTVYTSSASSVTYPTPFPGLAYPPGSVVFDLIAGAIIVAISIGLAVVFLRRKSPPPAAPSPPSKT